MSRECAFECSRRNDTNVMLTIRDLDYRIDARQLFEGASAQISAGWKVGLVGRNGTGKSTLLRLIREAFLAPAEQDAIRLSPQATLGWVAQEIAPGNDTLLNVVLEADHERARLLEVAETSGDPDQIAEAHARLTDIDAWSGEARAAAILAGLGFEDQDLTRPTREFSGGWRMRAALAGVLFAQPDLLLLDEPTNYLDLEGSSWLEAYLKTYPHTVVLVSHDRELLNRCVTHTLALENRTLHLSPGGYDASLALRAERQAHLQAQKVKQDAERAHLQAFVDRFRYKDSKARQAQSRLKRLQKMQQVSIPLSERTLPFHFPSGEERLAPPMLMLEGADLGYGAAAKILSAVSLRIDPEDRIAIVGTNGQGKTTLVKSIADRLPLMAGQRRMPGILRIGYFSQDQMDELALGESVLDHVRRALPASAGVAKLRAVAAGFGFSHDKVETAVENLSGGEKVRLLLGLMGMAEPHILVLDEPTSHLDIDSREALIHALNAFKGAVLLITHDVFLAEATADQLWLVKDGRVRLYDGDLNDYRQLVLQAERRARDSPATLPSEKRAPSMDRSERRRRASEARRLAAPLKRRAAEAEKRLEAASHAISDIDEQLSRPGLGSQDIQALMKRRSAQEAIIAEAEIDWLEASEAYEAAVAAEPQSAASTAVTSGT